MLFHAKQKDTMEALFLENKRLLISIVFNITKDAGSTDDVLHDLFLSAAKNRKTICGLTPEKQKSYLCAAAKHQAITAYRKKKQCLAKEMPFDDSAEIADAITLERLVVSREQLARVKALILDLPEALREVLERSVFYRLSDEAIAEELHISIDLVRVRKHRARERLKKELKEVNGDDKSR